jgi:threo-3-hydroxy-L-aspartate ammonia-lyase
VDDNALVKTMRFFAERMKMVIEPTGGLAAAAAMLGDSEGKLDVKGKRVGIIVSGGNVDIAYYAKLLRDGV